MHKYETIIYWSNDDRVFVAEVPELPGCMAHGDTPESALADAHKAIQLWIDTAREFGDPIPEPKGERLMLAWRLDPWHRHSFLCRRGTPWRAPTNAFHASSTGRSACATARTVRLGVTPVSSRCVRTAQPCETSWS